MKVILFRLCQTVLAVGLLAISVGAAVPTSMNYQGRLTTPTGAAVPDGSYDVVFTIYDASVGGVSKWSEAKIVTAEGGLFAVELGTSNPIPDTVFSNANRYLGVKVGSDPEMTPRARLVSVPYAYNVGTLNGATGGTIYSNLDLGYPTDTSGQILIWGVRFLHNHGTANTFVGENAGSLTTTGSYNTATGWSALTSNTFGVGNTASGWGALFTNNTGIQNTASGYAALFNNTSGYNNTASGHNALYSNTEGYENTASGRLALYSNTTGNQNTAAGRFSLYWNATGNQNTAIGNAALAGNTTGSDNTAIGCQANTSAGDLTNATAIGYQATVNASNKIRLGNGTVTVIEGQVAYTFTSDRDQKEHFQPVDANEVLRKIGGMHLTSWNYKNQDATRFRHYGPTAQEFYAAFGHDGLGQSGDSVSINSGDQAGILMIAVQALEKRTSEIAQVKAENTELKARLVKLEATVAQLAATMPATTTELVQK